jgi:hypothetical protein
MSDISLSVGSKLYVSAAAPGTYNFTGFEALVWTEVGEVETLGEFGGTATITPFIPLATGITKKRKGSIDYGTITSTVGKISAQQGQALLKQGFDGSNAYVIHSFKVEAEDGKVAYFTGVVASFTFNVGDANNVTRVGVNIDLDNRVLTDDYEALFTVTFIAGANGSIIGPTVQSVPSGGNTLAVYAAPANLYEFTAWSDANTDNPRTITNVLANATLTASFSLI